MYTGGSVSVTVTGAAGQVRAWFGVASISIDCNLASVLMMGIACGFSAFEEYGLSLFFGRK